MSMHVIFPGPRTTIQDGGRLGYQNSGFAPSGFIDRIASRMANALVDNDDAEAVLEFCLMGPTLIFDEEVNLAVCGGDFGINVDGRQFPADRAVHVPSGAHVRITTGSRGIYGSLAVGGGLDIPVVMGSRSTNLRCGIGGHEGRALLAGDTIALRHPENGRRDLSWRWVPGRDLLAPSDAGITHVRVIPGPQEDMFTEKGIRTFYESSYEVTSQSDRMGYRLQGPEVESANGCDILSDGIVNGSIQISGSGEPIVMMADRQTTGGYAKIAAIITLDIPRFAQLRPGQKVQFERCSVQEAQRLLREWDASWKEHRQKLDARKLALEREAQLEKDRLEKQLAAELQARELAAEQERQLRSQIMSRSRQDDKALTLPGYAPPGTDTDSSPEKSSLRRGWQKVPLSARRKRLPAPGRWRR